MPEICDGQRPAMHIPSHETATKSASRTFGCAPSLPVRPPRDNVESPHAAVNMSFCSEPLEVSRAKIPRMQVSFRVAVMAAISGSVFLSCAAMFIPLELFTQSLRHQASNSCRGALHMQQALIEKLLFDDVTQVIYSQMLGSVAESIDNSIVQPADRALESVHGQMLTMRKFNSSWTPCSPEGRKQVAAIAWSRLSSEWHRGPSTLNSISLACHDGSFAGYAIDAEIPSQGYVWEASAGGLLYARVTDLKTGHGNASFEEKEMAQGSWSFNESMAYRAQAELAEDFETRSRIWSKPSKSLSTLWTAPVGYCGNSTCFQAVLSVGVSLEGLARTCNELGHQLSRLVWAAEPLTTLTSSTSSLFIVDEEGLLAAPVSDLQEKGLLEAAVALLKHDWPQDLPARRLPLNFSRMAAEGSATHQHCPMEEISGGMRPVNLSDCYLMGIHPIKMDSQTRWLAVVVLPAGIFYSNQEQRVGEEFSQEIACQARTSGLYVLLAMTLASVVLGLVIGQVVARPLSHLFGLVSRLSELDFARESVACRKIRQGARRSSISDVCELQNAFCRLSRSLETFAHFVPETVVRNTVQLGDQGGTQLQVSRRDVTIMCTDIAGFTTISESLAQRDLLFILTRYFAVMMQVLELYEGVVSEILGDGLIVFWNAPDDVEDHAGKACAAALAQLEALRMLNAELQMLDLPQLSIRIGIHTGSSITGNIGSEAKMKYGCLGGTKQIAMKLEELCKHYGVNVICSSQTHAAAMGSWHFFFRKLDRVQVKCENISIHELICRNLEASETSSQRSTPSDFAGGMVEKVFSGAGAASASLARLICEPKSLWRDCRPSKWTRSRRSSGSAKDSMAGGEQDISELPDLPPLYMFAKAAAGIEVTEEKRRQVGLYEEALKAYLEGRIEDARRKAAALFAETKDTAAERLMEKTRRKISL